MTMSSCGGSTRSSCDQIHDPLLTEKLDHCDFDSSSETSEAWPQQSQSLWHRIACLCRTKSWTHDVQKILTVPLLILHHIRSEKSEDNPTQKKLHPTAYLDGMRGLAAFVVFLCHLSYGTFDLTHTYHAGKDEARKHNTSFLQLPGVRLLYSGPPMVAIFFVISGYVLSYKPLRQMQNQDHEALFLTITSSLFRRALRLFLPCVASTFVVVCLVQLGLYDLTRDFADNMRNISEGHTPTAPSLWLQLGDWMHKMLQLINVFDWSLYAGSIDLDLHLWTIPVEFRCSMALFATHMLIARMLPNVRLMVLSFLLMWGTYWDRWDMVPFWAGALLADIDLLNTDTMNLATEKPASLVAKDNRSSILGTLMNTTIFAIGIFLASYPDADGHVSPGYIILTKLIPKCYTQKHRFWPNIGAVMIVWAVGHLRFLRQTIFESRLMQYLGKISFPLYVCHGFIIHTLGYWLIDTIWMLTGAYDDWTRFQLGFGCSAFLIVAVTIWTSNIFLNTVDVRCVRFARWLEEKLFVAG